MLDIHVISHTHWDREWYLTHEQFRLRLVALVDRLLDLLDADPGYKHFHLDGQTIVLEDYLEIRPDQEERLRRAIQAGRILIGPWYVMPDEFLVSGESLVRNLARGHRISRQFGAPMPVGYLPDLFGHVAQMPQIWRQFGIDNTILWRGFGGRRAEYWWEAPDGSRVLMMHLPPEGYCNATRLVLDRDQVTVRATRAIDYERERTAVGQVLLMNGVDHVEPQAAVPALVEQLSTIPGQRACHSTLPAYVDAVRRAVDATQPALETATGELRGGEEYANLLPGVLSARVYLKQENAHVQTLLESYCEPLATCASLCGARYPDGELRHAWKVLLQNHPHDSICGCSIDAVHEENMTRFARARQVAEALASSSLDAIADAVPAAAGESLRVLTFNLDLTARTQVVEATIDLPVDSAEPWRLVDRQALDRPVRFWPRDARITSVAAIDKGVRVPFQVLSEMNVVIHEMSRFETPWALRVRRVHLLWWAPSLPPCGYTSFDVQLESGASDAVTVERPVLATDRSAENEFLRMTVNDDGSVDVVDKRTGIPYRGVGTLEDIGDVGDEYNYCPPATDRRITSSGARVVGIVRTCAGPLRAAFRIELELRLPAAAAPDRRSRVPNAVAVPVHIVAALDAASPRLDLAVTVENAARDHRLRLLFPLATDRVETARADTAFDVVSRPVRRDMPARIVNEAPVNSAPMLSAVDAGDDERGASVIARGLAEYEVVADPNTGHGSIALTLIRAVGDLSRNDLATRPSGHAGPPVATPAAQCLGRYTFTIAFEPHGAAPAAGKLLASARGVTVPPRSVAVRKPGGTAPTTRSFLGVTSRSHDVALSAFKKADDRDSFILRVFNPADVEVEADVTPGFAIARAFAVNFLEERMQELEVAANAVRVLLKPHEIRTIELVEHLS